MVNPASKPYERILIDEQVRERQLRLYGHVARLPVKDPAHRIFFRDPRGWTMPRGRLQVSWLRQV